MPTPEPDHPVAAAVREALARFDRSQTWLGVRVADIEGRSTPYSQAAVSQWLDRIAEQPPARIFAIEKALELKPGSLSQQLGYLPAASRPARSVVDAIRMDSTLTPAEQEMLIVSYRALRQQRRTT